MAIQLLASSGERQHGDRGPPRQLGAPPHALPGGGSDHQGALGQLVLLTPGHPLIACRRGGGELQELGSEALGLQRRFDAKLARQQLPAPAVLVQGRADPVLVHVQPDQAAVHALLQGIARKQPQRDLNRAIDRAGNHVVLEQALQRLLQHLVQAAAFRAQPIVEFLAARLEVLQQWSAIQADRPLQGLRRPVGDQALEPQDVDLEPVRPDGDMAGGDGKAVPCLVRQARAQPRQGLAQIRARLGFRVIAPQQRGQFARVRGSASRSRAGRRTGPGPCGSESAAPPRRARGTRTRRTATAAPRAILMEACAILSRPRQRASGLRDALVPLLSRARGRPADHTDKISTTRSDDDVRA